MSHNILLFVDGIIFLDLAWSIMLNYYAVGIQRCEENKHRAVKYI